MLIFLVAFAPAFGQTKTPTTTTLTLTSGGNAVTIVASGTVITLTATVQAAGAAVSPGQVAFCDASAAYCTDIHRLALAQLTTAGTATLKLRPGVGAHSYKAVFLGTNANAGSSSSTASLTVTGPFPSVTAIAQSGQAGNYTLTATVAGFGGKTTTTPPSGSISFINTTAANSVLATAALTAGSAGTTFINASNPSLGSEAVSIVAADFNGDGNQDLAVGLNSATQTAAILLGDGQGNFTPVTAGTISASGVPVLVQDFNGDGIPDLLMTSTTGGPLTVLLGRGDGTFTPAPGGSFTTLYGSYPVIAADFNGDGIPDLAIGGGYYMVILLGNGDGTFTQVPTSSSVVINVATSMVPGDFNGDGIADLAITGGSAGGTAIYLGNGDGTFRQGTAIANTTGLLTVGDFNNDGKEDIAVGNGTSVSIQLGNGDGTFSPAPGSPATAATPANRIAVGDFNGDGIPDIFIAGMTSLTDIAILLGNGDGSFQSLATGSTTLPCCTYNTLADFNGDGVTDIASVDFYTGIVQVLLTAQTQASATVNNIAAPAPGTQLIAASYPGDSTYSGSISATTSLTTIVATPALSVAPGTYTAVQTITISDATPGATIYYSAYGTANTSAWATYTGPIMLNFGGAETINVYATAPGSLNSPTVNASYYLNLPYAPPPSFSPSAGSYASAQQVTISDSVPGATIYYTTDGTYPTIYATAYTGPITVSGSETLIATAVAGGYTMSVPASAQYIINSAAASFIYNVAGSGGYGYSGDGGLATEAMMSYPSDAVVDSAGNLYIADSVNNVIRKVAAGTGVITTFAGNGIAGYSGDGGPAASAQLQNPTWLALDANGNLYVADTGNYVVRKIALTTGIITTVAGNGTAGESGDGGPATSASFEYVGGLVVDPSGNLYISDTSANRVREVAASTGTITTIAGGLIFSNGGIGDGGPATSAALIYPAGLALDAQGNLYIADQFDNAIRKVTASTQVITTVAGTGTGGHYAGYSGDGGPATSARLNAPYSVAFDASGNLYIADQGNLVIREVNAATNVINTVTSRAGCGALSGDGGTAADAGLCSPDGISFDRSGNLYIAEEFRGRVRRMTASALPPSTAAAAPQFSIAGGTFSGPQTVALTDATPGSTIYLTYDGSTPTTQSDIYRGPINVNGSITLSAVAVAPGYLVSAPSTASFTITTPPPAIISTVAGNGRNPVPTRAGQPAISTSFRSITDVAFDTAGNLYFPDPSNQVVWQVSAGTGTATIVAGMLGAQGYTGNGGPATSAELKSPDAIAIDHAGNLYIADTGNNQIRRVDAVSGIISAYAGVGPSSGYGQPVGDGGPATSANLQNPQGVRFDSAGNLYIADSGNDRVRVVSATTGIITTVAGNGAYSGPLGDGGPATSARLNYPLTMAFDSQGNLYIADLSNLRVRKVAAGTGIISTIAGNGDDGSSGDGLPATQAEIIPWGLAIDGAGDLYISDGEAEVRELAAGSNVLTTVAGTGYFGYGQDGISATLSSLCDPEGLAFDSSGALYIASYCDARVRKLTFSNTAATPQFSVAAGTYTTGQTVSITDATAGATIYYTTDGTVPTTDSTVYSGPVQVDHSETLQAIAVAGGYATSPIAAAAYTINLAKPVVTVTPSSSSIMTTDPLSVAVTVSGGNGNPIPTGSIAVSSGAYSSAAVNLSNGSATIQIPAGSLAAGSDTLTATYTPDSSSAAEFASVSGSAVVVVTAPKTAPAVLVTPAAQSITTIQALSVAVTVTGSNGIVPTGSVVLSSGTYQSAPAPLATGAATVAIPAGSLPAGTDTLTVSYTPDSSAGVNYNAATGSATVTVTKATPAIAISLLPTAITTAQPLGVTIAVAGGANAVPTGTVTLTSGSYTSQQTLASGSASITVPAGALPAGTDTLSVAYTPDSASAALYTAATQTATVVVSVPIGTAAATISITPSASTVTDQQAVTIAVSVAGGSGQPTPTGSTTLTAGSYSAQQTLSNGAATFQIPPGTLAVGADTVSIAYSGDATYAAKSATTSITVSNVVMTTSAPAAVSPGGNTTSTLKLLAGGGYSGTVNLTCALTSSPSGAQSLPTCGLNPGSVTLTAGGSATSTLTVQTTAASATATLHPAGQLLRWFGTGGVSLAALFFFGIPARRRRWIASLAFLFAITALAGIGCGGGGSNQGSGGGSPPTPATTAGTYVFTVTAADSSSSKTIATATVTITVQ